MLGVLRLENIDAQKGEAPHPGLSRFTKLMKTDAVAMWQRGVRPPLCGQRVHLQTLYVQIAYSELTHWGYVIALILTGARR
jgi:hypothetical protein